MLRVKNLTNSPFVLEKPNGERVHVPAFDSVEGDFASDYLDLMVSCGTASIEVVEAQKEVKRGRPAKVAEESQADQE